MRKYLFLVLAALAVSLNTQALTVHDNDDESYSLDDMKSEKKKGLSLGVAYGSYSLSGSSASKFSYAGQLFMDVAKNVPLSLGVAYNMGVNNLSVDGIKEVSVYSVYVPLHIGYRYQPNPMKIFCVSLSAGPYADYQIVGSETYSSKSKLISLTDAEDYKKLSFGVSARLNLYITPIFNFYVEGGLGLIDRIKGEKDNFWHVGYFYQF